MTARLCFFFYFFPSFATPRCLNSLTPFPHKQTASSRTLYLTSPSSSSILQTVRSMPLLLLSRSLILVSSVQHFLRHPSPPAHPVLSVCSAGGSRGRRLGVTGEGAPSADSQPEPVPAGAPTVPASGAAQQQAAQEAQR